MQRVAFVYGEESQALLDEVRKYTLSLDLTFLSFEAFMHQKIHFHKVLVSGNIYEIKAVFFRAISNGFEVGIIPHPNQEALRDSFSLSKDMFENLQTALNNSAKPMDILYANGQIVLHIALIGDAPPLSYRLLAYHQKSFKEKIRLLFEAYQKIRFLKHTKVKIVSKKQQTFETVATGIIAIEHDNKTFASKLIDNSVSENDAKLDVLIISPNSIVEYLKFIITTLFQSKSSSLPSSVGYIKSEQLKVESTMEMPLSIDGEKVGTTPVEFIVKPQALKISLPDIFWKKEHKEASKEQIKVDKLPKSKENMSYLQKRLPLFTHAGEEQYQTQEMAGRIKPSVLDMIVAIISGFAAAYLKNSEKLSASIAGVAIAVALVPPIATAGIGLGWSDNEMFYQAFLLFLTNLIGISFAVSLLFFMQGFSPMKRAKKALFYTLIISLIISFPLLNSFISMSQDAKVISLLEHQSFEINGKRVTLQNLSLSRDNRTEVLKCELLVKEILNHQELNELKTKIEKKLKRNIELEALFRVRF